MAATTGADRPSRTHFGIGAVALAVGLGALVLPITPLVPNESALADARLGVSSDYPVRGGTTTDSGAAGSGHRVRG